MTEESSGKRRSGGTQLIVLRSMFWSSSHMKDSGTLAHCSPLPVFVPCSHFIDGIFTPLNNIPFFFPVSDKGLSPFLVIEEACVLAYV